MVSQLLQPSRLGPQRSGQADEACVLAVVFLDCLCLVIYSETEVVVLTGCRGVLGAAAAEGQADFPAEVLAGHGGFGSVFLLSRTGDDAVDQSDGDGVAGRMLVIYLNKVGETRQEKVRLRSETKSFPAA
jgi:hypothetical protein